MLESAAGLCREDGTPAPRSTGAIVFSASCRLLFIDRTAIDLLGTVDPDWRAPTGAQPVPRCLMTIVREIAARHSAISSGPQSPLARVTRLLGPHSQPVRVEGFPVAYPQRQETRIVLVLSQ
jgi:hypothetical protein